MSYAGDDAFEASLFQYAIEQLLGKLMVTVWTYHRDQSKSERKIGKSLKDRVRESEAAVFLLSPSTFSGGATQWMELAYADAFDVPAYILLHRMTFAEMKERDKVPPLVLERQCNPSSEWKSVVDAIRVQLEANSAAKT